MDTSSLVRAEIRLALLGIVVGAAGSWLAVVSEGFEPAAFAVAAGAIVAALVMVIHYRTALSRAGFYGDPARLYRVEVRARSKAQARRDTYLAFGFIAGALYLLVAILRLTPAAVGGCFLTGSSGFMLTAALIQLGLFVVADRKWRSRV